MITYHNLSRKGVKVNEYELGVYVVELQILQTKRKKKKKLIKKDIIAEIYS